MKRFLAGLALLCAALTAGCPARAQTTTVTASHIVDVAGNPFTGNFCVQPTQQFVMGGGGNVLPTKVCYSVSNGILQSGVVLADTSQTNPVNVCYNVTLQDAVSAQVYATYPCMQPSGATYSFDNFVQTPNARMSAWTIPQLSTNGVLNGTQSVLNIAGSGVTYSNGTVTIANGGGSFPVGTGYVYGNGSQSPSFSTTIPYSNLTGAPAIPGTSNWPGAGSCTAGEFFTAIANGQSPTCNQVLYSELSGAPSSFPPSGAAGGDLSGDYPDPSVAKVNGASVPVSETYVGTNANGQIVAAPTPPSAPVTSVFGRTGAVTAQGGDYSYSQISGTPVLPGTTAAASHKWINAYNASTGLFGQSQPAFSDLSGSLAASQLPAFGGDASSTAGSSTLTLATVNSGPGQCGDSTHVCQVTTNGKGLVTSQAAVAIQSGGAGTVTNVAGSNSGGFAVSTTNPTTTPVISVAADSTHYLPTQADESNWNGKQNALGYSPAHSGSNSDITSLTGLTTPLPVSEGGTGTASPSLVAGSNVTITGTWPNQTIAASGSGGSMPTATEPGQMVASTAAGTSYAVQPQVFYSQAADTIASIESECSSACTYISTIPQTFTLAANHTLNANVSVEFTGGGEWTVNGSGFTLTIPGRVSGPPAQHFAGTGSIALGAAQQLADVEWFGAVGDWNGSTGTNNLSAIQACINALSYGSCQLQPQNYMVSGTISITKSNVGIAGPEIARGGYDFVAGHGAAIVETSASADVIDLTGASAANPVTFNQFRNFSINRTVVPTGTAAGMSWSFTGGALAYNISVNDSVRGFYIHSSPSYGQGGLVNCSAQWGYNGVTETSGTYYGFYLDSADGNAENSLVINGSSSSTNSLTGITTYGMLLTGTALNDVQTFNFHAAHLSYGQVATYTGSGGSTAAQDIHFVSSVIDTFGIAGFQMNGLPQANRATVTIEDAWLSGVGGATAAVDVENSYGVIVANSQFMGGGSPGFLANGSDTLTVSGNTFGSTIAGAAAIELNNTNHSAITGNTLTFGSGSVPQYGVFLTGTSSYDTITGNSVSGYLSKWGIFTDTTGTSYNAVVGNTVDPTHMTSGGVGTNGNGNIVFDTSLNKFRSIVDTTLDTSTTHAGYLAKGALNIEGWNNETPTYAWSLGFTYPTGTAGNNPTFAYLNAGTWAEAWHIDPATGILHELNGLATTTLDDLTSNTYGVQATALATPGAPSGTPSTTGGTLAAGTYTVEIAAVDGLSDSTAVGPSTPFTTTGTTGSVALTWTAIPNATSYQIWLTTGQYFTSTAPSFTLTTATGTSGTIPTTNGTGVVKANVLKGNDLNVPMPLSCQPGLGDGLNAIPAGTYHSTTCKNDTGKTWTITSITCVTDSGTSTCDATNGAGSDLLTARVTGSATYAAGTQSATTTIAPGDYLKVTFVADGTTKQIGIDVAGTYQ